MIKITLEAPRNESGNVPTVEVELPVVPQKGDYIDHEPSGITGYVIGVDYWWEESTDKLNITVRLR